MLSIIIVNYHSWHFIERNLDNLLDSFPQDIDKSVWPFEVIVADNSLGNEGLAAFSQKFPQVIIHKTGGNFGYSYACNQGASKASGDWLLFMNPDVICDWQNLRSFTEGAKQQTQYQILSAPQYSLKPKRLQRTFAPFPSLLTHFPTLRIILRLVAPQKYPNPRKDPITLNKILTVDWVTGSLLLISRAGFDKIKGWDEDFWLYCEDVDLCKRANLAGLSVGYYPFARFVHSHACSTRTNPATKILTKSETVISTYVYLLKHHPDTSGHILRFLLRLRTTLRYPLLQLLSTLSRQKIAVIEQKKNIHQRLWHYYKRVQQTGNTLSDHSIAFAKIADKDTQKHIKQQDITPFSYTCVLTSCRRFDLLQNTLSSLLKNLDIPPEAFIIIEDSADEGIYAALEPFDYPFQVILNGANLGQARSIDLAYQQVTTPYIFHCEDDWEFIRTGFIQESLTLLQKHPNVSVVQLRGRVEHNKLLKLPSKNFQGIDYFLAEKSTDKRYFSYGYNPSLRRLVDYQHIAPFADIGGESEVSWIFKRLGFVTAHLEDPAVRHTGDEHHIEDHTAPKIGVKRKLRSWVNMAKRLKWFLTGFPKKREW